MHGDRRGTPPRAAPASAFDDGDPGLQTWQVDPPGDVAPRTCAGIRAAHSRGVRSALLLPLAIGCATTASDPMPTAEDPRPEAPPSAASCEEDEHACGTSCVMQQANDPAVGCSFGCN